jgi:four helix bundle protein
MTSCRDLLVWHRGMDLLEALYGFTRILPRDERFGLCSQLQRAGVSIPANVAEGQSRRSDGAFLNHVSIAIGSQAELETLLEACRRLKFGEVSLLERCESLARETGRMLYGLHASLHRSRARKRALLYSTFLGVFGFWFLASAL